MQRTVELACPRRLIISPRKSFRIPKKTCLSMVTRSFATRSTRRLERYVIADDVQIEDVTDEFSLFHVFTEKSPTARVSTDRLGASLCGDSVGTYGPTRRSTMLCARIGLSISVFIDPASRGVMRIEQGLPLWRPRTHRTKLFRSKPISNDGRSTTKRVATLARK